MNVYSKLESGWEVSWCHNLPRAEYSFIDFKTKEKAVHYAKEILPLDQFGAVRVTPFHTEEYEPGVFARYREYESDSIEISE